MNNSQLAMMIKRLKKRCAQRLERIKQLELEKEALLKALKIVDLDCEHCKHRNTMEDVCKLDCSDRELDADKCPCNKCRNNSHWEWAGIKEDLADG